VATPSGLICYAFSGVMDRTTGSLAVPLRLPERVGEAAAKVPVAQRGVYLPRTGANLASARILIAGSPAAIFASGLSLCVDSSLKGIFLPPLQIPLTI
jgi:hypothetical protein